jgi:hypothetical protein
MSNEEIEQDDQDGTGAAGEQLGATDDGGDDNVDSAFVVPSEKQPLSKGTLAMFLVIAVAGAGTYFMYVRAGPETARGAVDPDAQRVIKQFMSDRTKNKGAMEQMLRDTESVVKQFLNYPSVKQIPLSSLTANPFRMTAAPADQTPAQVDDREKKQREEERLAVRKAAEALLLQSVMHSDARKSCMINNALYLEGQQIDTFTIEKISPNSVIVRRGAYRFELKMQR